MARRRWGSIETVVPGEVYRIHWKDGHKADGKRRPASMTVYGTFEDADFALAVKRVEMEGVDGSTTWAQFWDAKVAPTLDDLARRTKKDYVEVWGRHLEPLIGADAMADADYGYVCAAIAQIKAPSAQRYAHRLWKKVCNMAMREKVPPFARNPVDRSVPMKPLVPRRKHEVDACDLVGYIRSIEAQAYKCMAVLEMAGGLRHEEAVPILPRNVRRSRGYAEVEVVAAYTSLGGGDADYKGTKTTGSERVVLLAEPFASVVLEWADAADGPLFPGRRPVGEEPNGSWFLMPNNVTKAWKRWCEANGVRYVRPADMRTIYSDRCGEAGIPDSLVSLSMGHTVPTTRGSSYQRRTRKGMEFVADALAEYLVTEHMAADSNQIIEDVPRIRL